MIYGSRVVAAGATSDPYGQRYKGIWICLDLLKKALGGNYVNFGVFELYGDPALKVLCPARHLPSNRPQCANFSGCQHCYTAVLLFRNGAGAAQ